MISHLYDLYNYLYPFFFILKGRLLFFDLDQYVFDLFMKML